MPLVNIRTMRGALSDAQKAELHARVTDLMVEIEGRGRPPFRPFVTVMIEELEPPNWSMGGKQASEEFVRRITGKAP
jgi:4-oxalocrotonate tautomerase